MSPEAVTLEPPAPAVPEVPTTRWKVLYHCQAPWLIGERQEDRDLRVARGYEVSLAELYRDDYPGMVISVIPAGRDFSPGDLADPTRAVAELDLAPDGLADLRSRRSRLVLGALGVLAVDAVPFDAKYGAIAPGLRAAFQDPEDLEAHEDERIREAMDENMRRDLAHADALAVYAESLKTVVEGGELVAPETLPKPAPLVLLEIPEPLFGLKASGLSRALPRTTVHTGAGLYEVGPGKTYSTIQSALDQLWTDQGATKFTASQYIRVFAGTYDETPTPNAAFTTDPLNGYPLIIEGDPADSRENIIIAPTTGSPTYGVYVNCDEVILRHLRIAGSPTTAGFSTSSGNGFAWVDDCDIEVPATGVTIVYQGRVTDCRVEVTVDSKTCVGVGSWGQTGGYVARCTLIGGGKTNSFGVNVLRDVVVEDCTIRTVNVAVYTGYNVYTASLYSVRNCTFYDCNFGVWIRSGWNQRFHLVNNAFEDVGYVFYPAYVWPEETATKAGSTVVMRNNCFHGYTAFAYGPGAATKTYAEFAALNLVDASGDKDATDPLLTDPAAGDFSLQSGSPCWDTGHGSGVTTDYLGTVMDAAHPPIGAWSPGALVKVPPTMSVVVSGTTITATLAGSAQRYRVRLSTAAGVEVSESSRAGAGDVAFAGNAEGTHYRLQAWAVTADDASVLGEPSIVHDAYVELAAALTPTGCLAEPIENLRCLLAASDDFQALVGAGDAAGAKGSVHYPYQDADDYARPCALIEGCESWNARQPAVDTVACFLHAGEMAVTIERDVDEAYAAAGDERDAYLAFANAVGAIVSDLESGAISWLDVRSVRVASKPQRTSRRDKAQERDFYTTTLAVEWGG